MVEIKEIKEWLEEFDYSTSTFENDNLIMNPPENHYDYIKIKKINTYLSVSFPLYNTRYQYRTRINLDNEENIYRYLDLHLIEPYKDRYEWPPPHPVKL